jgi:hypothetical protein
VIFIAEFASRGVGNAGLTTGIIGTAGWLLNGGLGNILGGLGGGCVPSENMPVTRYDAGKDATIMRLENENSLLKSNTYVDGKMLELYRYVDGKFGAVDAALAQQAVYNATQTSVIGCMQQQVAQLQGLTKLVIPTASICPAPMPLYNSWTAPTAPATGA